MRKSRSLALEALEDRCVPHATSPWPDASHLTFSFAPDGTTIGARSSDLQATLNGQLPGTWQREALRALQTWAMHANVNIGIVDDEGNAFGVAGRAQGDSRFGDIRLAGYVMSPEVVGVASGYEAAAGTWSGDVRLNTSYSFGPVGPSQHDLFSAYLHEFGHALGLEHSDDPSSAMYENLGTTHTGLSAGDIAEIQELYGVRSPDEYEDSLGNDSFANASRVSLLNLADGVLAGKAEADLTRSTDVDFYEVRTILSTGLTFRVQTQGRSLLQAKLSVYDANKRLVASVASPGPDGGNLEVRINRVQLLSKYYVKVESATSDAFGVGSYLLKVDSLPGVTGVVDTTGGVVDNVTALLNNDLHLNDTFLTASLVPQLFAGTDSRFDFAYKASISDSWDVDFYKVQAPQVAAGAANVMQVAAWGLEENGLEPRVAVFDALYRPVAAQVLVNEQGNYVVQVPNVVGGAKYFVKLSRGSAASGNYFLGIDFNSNLESHPTLASGTLNAAQTQAFHQLDIEESVLYHLLLSLNDYASNVEAGIRLTIYDADDNVVVTRVAFRGETVSSNVLLAPGTYLVRVAAATRTGAALPDVIYGIAGSKLDGPVGPQPNDATGAPSGGGGGGGGTTSPTWTGTTSRMSSTDPYGGPYG